MWKATNQGLICNINQCSKCRCVIALYSCCVPVHCNTSPYNKSSCCNSCVSEANNFYIQDRWLCGHSGAANSRIRASAEPSALLQKLFAPVCFSLIFSLSPPERVNPFRPSITVNFHTYVGGCFSYSDRTNFFFCDPDRHTGFGCGVSWNHAASNSNILETKL